MSVKRILISIVALSIFIAAGCGNNEPETLDEDIKGTVHSYSVDDHGDIEASITSDELIVTEGDVVEETALPEDEFFVSIAPFIETTHPCAVHSLTGCQGELVEEDFGVKIMDEEGDVIVDDEMTSFENGFIDLWLPREQKLSVEIEHEGKTAQSEISTFEGDDTCITTMQLE